MDIAQELPQLIASHQLRARIHQVHVTASGFGVLLNFNLMQLGLQRSMQSKPIVLCLGQVSTGHFCACESKALIWHRANSLHSC